jgi:chromate transporter
MGLPRFPPGHLCAGAHDPAGQAFLNVKTQGQAVTLSALFFRFLLIGATSFGGFMALVSMVQKEVVERRKWLQSSVLLDAVSVGSFLPGPLAVNVVAFCGYRLRGMPGALVGMAAVLLPTFLLILGLSELYFRYGSLPEVSSAFSGIVPAVCAVVAAVALDMARKHLSDYRQGLIFVISTAIMVLFGGFYSTLLIMIAGATAGMLLKPGRAQQANENGTNVRADLRVFLVRNAVFLAALTALVLMFAATPWVFPQLKETAVETWRQLAFTFGTVSLTLFGGGYVFIPMLQQLIVDQLNWLDAREFADGIALGQVTPGPIMITAAFVGYKLAGIAGAAVATVAMFLPPALVMIFVSGIIDNLKSNPRVLAAFYGLRPAVIGMIASAAWALTRTAPQDVRALAIGLVVFFMITRFKITVAYLIPLSGVAGYLLFGN